MPTKGDHKQIEVLSWSWGVTLSPTTQSRPEFDGEITFGDDLVFSFEGAQSPAVGLAVVKPAERGDETTGIETFTLNFTKIDGDYKSQVEAHTDDNGPVFFSLDDPNMHDLQTAFSQILSGDYFLV